MATPTAVVTGAKLGGMGFSFASVLARRGYRVALFGRDKAGLLAAQTELVRLANGSEGDFPMIIADLATMGTVATAFTRARELLATDFFDVIVNNAGAFAYGYLNSHTIMILMYVAVQDACELALKWSTGKLAHKAPRPVLVVNVSSVGSLMPGATTVVYSSAKAAVDSITRCAASWEADWGIRVVSILPNFVATKMAEKTHLLPGMEEVMQAQGHGTGVQPMEAMEEALERIMNHPEVFRGGSVITTTNNDGGRQLNIVPPPLTNMQTTYDLTGFTIMDAFGGVQRLIQEQIRDEVIPGWSSDA